MPFTKLNGQSTPAIAAINYAFPEGSRTVGELADERQLKSSAETMESFGFGNLHVALTETPYELAVIAAKKLLEESKIDRESVGLLIYGGTPGSMAFAPSERAESAAAELCTMSRFKYPSTRLQYDLHLHNASTVALDHLACTTLLTAVRIGRLPCLTEGIERAICVSSALFPANARREAIFTR